MIKINKEDFIENYSSMTYEQLAERYGISRSSVRNIVKQLGLNKPVGVKKKIVVD